MVANPSLHLYSPNRNLLYRLDLVVICDLFFGMDNIKTKIVVVVIYLKRNFANRGGWQELTGLVSE